MTSSVVVGGCIVENLEISELVKGSVPVVVKLRSVLKWLELSALKKLDCSILEG